MYVAARARSRTRTQGAWRAACMSGTVPKAAPRRAWDRAWPARAASSAQKMPSPDLSLAVHRLRRAADASQRRRRQKRGARGKNAPQVLDDDWAQVARNSTAALVDNVRRGPSNDHVHRHRAALVRRCHGGRSWRIALWIHHDHAWYSCMDPCGPRCARCMGWRRCRWRC